MFRKVFNLIYKIISTAVILFAFLFAVMYLSGIHMYHVKSGSMGMLIPYGSICFVSQYSQYEDVKVNDVIAFRHGDMLVTHRAVAITENGIITRGDSNEINDTNPVTKEEYLGKTVFAIPEIGYLLKWTETRKGKLILGIFVGVIIISGFFYHEDTSH